MSRTKHLSALHQTKAQADHALYGHTWTATFTQGEFICTICGTLAYCPRCISSCLIGKPLRWCATHRPTAPSVDNGTPGASQNTGGAPWA
ncbi:MAG: hypothetical protein H0W02_01925 [Ktedonobacteraceae bacterium]|nr:hypothetical protein [Ktedonobacteraceae bacterium]